MGKNKPTKKKGSSTKALLKRSGRTWNPAIVLSATKDTTKTKKKSKK